jgi:hypothetical protein
MDVNENLKTPKSKVEIRETPYNIIIREGGSYTIHYIIIVGSLQHSLATFDHVQEPRMAKKSEKMHEFCKKKPLLFLLMNTWWVLKSKGRFTLWPKVKRPSIFTNQIARNQEFGLSTLHTRGQSPKVITLQNVYMTILFDQGNGLSKEV